MPEALLPDAVRAAATRVEITLEPWLLTRAVEVDRLVRLAAAEEVEVARQRRIGRYSPRGLSEPPGRTLRRKLVREPEKAVAVQEAVIEVLAFGWLAGAPDTDAGYHHHSPEALWNAWTVNFVSNDALDGVEWASGARSAAASIWTEKLKAAGLWSLKGRARQRFLAAVYFGAGVVLHLLQRSEDISSPMVTMTAKWPMRELPLLPGGG